MLFFCKNLCDISSLRKTYKKTAADFSDSRQRNCKNIKAVHPKLLYIPVIPLRSYPCDYAFCE